jgi:hypothetical protein
MKAHKIKMDDKPKLLQTDGVCTENEGNKLKQILSKLKQDEIRLSGGVSLQRGMSDRRHNDTDSWGALQVNWKNYRMIAEQCRSVPKEQARKKANNKNIKKHFVSESILCGSIRMGINTS